MKFHLVTVGSPKLDYAKSGFSEYASRLEHYHQVRITHIPDKQNDTTHLLASVGNAYFMPLVIEGTSMSSPELAAFITKRATHTREICFMIGGPEGLPVAVREEADFSWSLSALTLPHDLAMVVLAETLYRASTIAAGLPYHK